MKTWHAIIFDLDDTLYSEMDYVLSGMRAVARWARGQFGLCEEDAYSELLDIVQQGVDGRTFNRWLNTRELPETWVPSMVQAYREHEPRITLHRGIRYLLEQLRLEYKLGIITDGYLEVQQRKVAALKVESYFDEIVYSDQWGREAWKPSPTPFQHILRRLGISANTALYVGDNPAKDFYGARSLGMGTLRVRFPSGIHRHIDPVDDEHAPDRSVNTTEELMAFFNKSAAA